MKKALTFMDFFKFPLYVDDFVNAVFDSEYFFVLDVISSDIATTKTIVDILNGDCKGKMTGKLSYSNGNIYLNDKIFMYIMDLDYCIRNFGLTLSMEEAAEIQDEFGNWICEKLME